MQKHKSLSKAKEILRAKESIDKGICFISKESLANKDYDLVWHAGSNSYVLVEQSYLNIELQKESQNIININLIS